MKNTAFRTLNKINKASFYLKLPFVLLFVAPSVRASSECYGRTNDNKEVRVAIETNGAMGAPSHGEIIFSDEQNHYGFQLDKGEISQYYEYDENSDGSAVVGLVAYSHHEAPVSIKYVGTNFKDMDLKTVFESGEANKLNGNFIRVWKGPGFASSNQFQITQFVCATWPDL